MSGPEPVRRQWESFRPQLGCWPALSNYVPNPLQAPELKWKKKDEKKA
jgi:hypothetical protein